LRRTPVNHLVVGLTNSVPNSSGVNLVTRSESPLLAQERSGGKSTFAASDTKVSGTRRATFAAGPVMPAPRRCGSELAIRGKPILRRVT
jgi:hypothetical protein